MLLMRQYKNNGYWFYGKHLGDQQKLEKNYNGKFRWFIKCSLMLTEWENLWRKG